MATIITIQAYKTIKNVELFCLCSTNIPLIPKSFWTKLSVYDWKSNQLQRSRADPLHVYTCISLVKHRYWFQGHKCLKFKNWNHLLFHISIYYTKVHFFNTYLANGQWWAPLLSRPLPRSPLSPLNPLILRITLCTGLFFSWVLLS